LRTAIFLGNPLILADECLILADECLILVDEVTILAHESLRLVHKISDTFLLVVCYKIIEK